jgi:hypothetical protein
MTLFEPFMAFFFPDAHRGIDWTQPHDPLEQELQEITPASEQGRRVADKLFKLRRTSGQVEWVLVHIEFQSQPAAEFARRMYVYNYRLFDRYNQKVASFAILGDDRPDWRPDRFGYELWGTEVGIRVDRQPLENRSQLRGKPRRAGRGATGRLSLGQALGCGAERGQPRAAAGKALAVAADSQGPLNKTPLAAKAPLSRGCRFRLLPRFTGAIRGLGSRDHLS